MINQPLLYAIITPPNANFLITYGSRLFPITVNNLGVAAVASLASVFNAEVTIDPFGASSYMIAIRPLPNNVDFPVFANGTTYNIGSIYSSSTISYSPNTLSGTFS